LSSGFENSANVLARALVFSCRYWAIAQLLIFREGNKILLSDSKVPLTTLHQPLAEAFELRGEFFFELNP
jgi:hypothetical protein